MRASASFTAVRLRARPASERPAPRPTASCGSSPSRAQATAARGGGVADAHLPGSENIRFLLRRPAARAGPGQYRLLTLGAGHGGTLGNVVGPRADTAVHKAGDGRVGQHAHIHRHYPAICLSGHVADGAVAFRQGLCHHGGDAAVCLGNPPATTPLSAQSTSRVRLCRRTSALPVTAAMRAMSSSSAPRLPSGFARASQ